ncbi:hypothetical protein SASPL_115809 [Salvia splendens]|uniref:Xyloglucan 6-xylosyltransferase n=1 Tax=Salvia splendens TaxID=180675 RepID=A0A8X8Y3V8_SALSN|nr:galactomannan galactosyltransferase 1-like [Salvia splendens]KAG6425378.1 hypothetical protein SASPL_115809 [Salvia splendens]
MVSPDHSHFTIASTFRLGGAALVAFMFIWTICSSFNATPIPPTTTTPTFTASFSHYDSPERNFYDDPKLSYSLGSSHPMKGWDEKRQEWLKQHPSFASGALTRIVMVTGSQPGPCKSPIGDHLLLKLFKNKVDYCRHHGIDIFYNNALLHPQMFFFWAKSAAVRATMLAHPEAEWIWWVDSDAAFTDMDFVLPLRRYDHHNMVVYGWDNVVREKHTWTGINAGVFLLRNSQWALDFLEVWASMGPQSPDYEKWGKTQNAFFKDKRYSVSDDQSGLIYLYLNEKWGEKIYVEEEYYFQGYWAVTVPTFENVTARYTEIERSVAALRRRHAEKVSEGYARVWDEQLKGKGSLRRPFVTHFTGCQPCSGDNNPIYSSKSCVDDLIKALTFADNQVLRNYGYMHRDINDPSIVNPLPFNYPA